MARTKYTGTKQNHPKPVKAPPRKKENMKFTYEEGGKTKRAEVRRDSDGKAFAVRPPETKSQARQLMRAKQTRAVQKKVKNIVKTEGGDWRP